MIFCGEGPIGDLDNESEILGNSMKAVAREKAKTASRQRGREERTQAFIGSPLGEVTVLGLLGTNQKCPNTTTTNPPRQKNRCDQGLKGIQTLATSLKYEP